MDKQQRAEFIRRASFISEADRDMRAAFVDEIAQAAAPQPPSALDERETVQCNCPGGTKSAALHAPNCPVRLRDAVLIDPYDGGTWVAPSPGVDAAEQKPCATCGGSKVDPGGLPICRDCAGPSPAASADEWMAEHMRLVDQYGDAMWAAGKTLNQRHAIAARAALLAHLKVRP